jgi:hypothetical protein
VEQKRPREGKKAVALYLAVHDKGRNTDGLGEKRPLAVQREHAPAHGQGSGALGQPPQLCLLFGLHDDNTMSRVGQIR